MNLCCLFNVIEPKNILGFNAQFIIYRVRKRSLPPPPKMTQNEFSCHFESFLGEGANSTSAPCDLICHQKFSIFKLNLLEFLDYFGQYKNFQIKQGVCKLMRVSVCSIRLFFWTFDITIQPCVFRSLKRILDKLSLQVFWGFTYSISDASKTNLNIVKSFIL